MVSGSLGQNCSVDLVVAGSDDENTVRTLARPRTMHTRRSPQATQWADLELYRALFNLTVTRVLLVITLAISHG